jgi:hypothetical protein
LLDGELCIVHYGLCIIITLFIHGKKSLQRPQKLTFEIHQLLPRSEIREF